jgi:hypothetical protein
MHIEPWKKGELAISDHDVWCAQVIRTLRQAGPSLPPEVLNMSIPQKHCCFAFGPNKISLPAGAVLRLWSVDPVSTGICPDCGGEVLATAFGGLLNLGGYPGLCIQCGRPMFRWVGGLATMAIRTRPYFEGTPWYSNGCVFGGAYASDGVELAAALGLPAPPKDDRDDGPRIEVGDGGMRLVQEVEVEDEK